MLNQHKLKINTEAENAQAVHIVFLECHNFNLYNLMTIAQDGKEQMRSSFYKKVLKICNLKP